MSRPLAAAPHRLPGGAAAWALVAASTAFLVVLRPGLGLAPLAAGYLLLLGAAATAIWSLSGPPRRVQVHRRYLTPSLVVLAVGLGAVVVARLASAPAPPLRDDAAALSLNLLAAVSEEALFRGLLFSLLLGLAAGRRGAAGLAVVGTAAAFAALHLPAYGLAALPVDFGAGLLLGWQRHASGGWTVPAATHAAANLLAVI